MTLQMLKAVPAGARGVASADRAPPAASATGVPPRAPLPMKAITIAAATPISVMMAIGQGLWSVARSSREPWHVAEYACASVMMTSTLRERWHVRKCR